MDPQDPCCGHDRADSCSNARTNDAMWAVFYHSYFQSPFRLCHTSPPVAPRLPAELQPLELDRAVEVLVQDPGGARRQWRALVRLLMEGLHTHERYRPLLRQLAQSIHAEELQFKLENFFPADTQADRKSVV